MKSNILLLLLFLVAFAICQEDDTGDETSAPETSSAIASETSSAMDSEIPATSTAMDEASSALPTATSTLSSDDTAQPTAIETSLPAVNRTVSPTVCQNLQQLYKALNGNTWIVRTGWDSTDMSTCCSWYNVHCNSIGQVLKL